MRRARSLASAQARARYSRAQNLKPYDDESENSDDNSKFDVFAEELDNKCYDLIAYD